MSLGSAVSEGRVEQAVQYLSLGQGSRSRCQRWDGAFIYQSSLICFAFPPDVNKQAPPTTRTTPPLLPPARPRRPSIPSFLPLSPPPLLLLPSMPFLLHLPRFLPRALLSVDMNQVADVITHLLIGANISQARGNVLVS